MTLLTKEQILGADDLEREEVEVSQWGGSVLVQGLTAKQRGILMDRLIDQRGNGRKLRLADIQVLTCALSIVDADGARMFSDMELSKLASKSSAALQAVFEVAQRLSGLSDEQVEELAKNSEETPIDD